MTVACLVLLVSLCWLTSIVALRCCSSFEFVVGSCVVVDVACLLLFVCRCWRLLLSFARLFVRCCCLFLVSFAVIVQCV